MSEQVESLANLTVSPPLTLTRLGRTFRLGMRRERLRATPLSAGSAVRELLVVRDESDSIICTTADLPEEGNPEASDEIEVAKPWILRRAPFDELSRDGRSYVYNGLSDRDATIGDVTEREIIWPRYLRGDTVYVTKIPPLFDGTVIWLDLNVDARAWAEPPEGTESG